MAQGFDDDLEAESVLRAILETGIERATSAKVFKSGNISAIEVIKSWHDSLNEGFSDWELEREEMPQPCFICTKRQSSSEMIL